MNTNDFDFELPEELIAQTPLEQRDASKLLVIDPVTKEMTDTHFDHIIDQLNPGDALVMNNTRVLPARLYGEKPDTHGHVEFLLLKNTQGDQWEVLAKPAKRLKVGATVSFGDGRLTATVTEELDHGGRIVELVYLTLHVGLGTFRPVSVENVDEHEMHSEFYTLSQEAADTLNSVKASGGRIVAVGTTSIRTLETIGNKFHGQLQADSGWTNIFIKPGYQFTVVDAFSTNFHLPKSTLVMLVSAFAGREFVLDAYKHAVQERYRFFSFGDAMFVTRRAEK